MGGGGTNMKLLAFIAAASMLLGSYLLRGLQRRLGEVLDEWGRDPLDRWSPAVPSATK